MDRRNFLRMGAAGLAVATSIKSQLLQATPLSENSESNENLSLTLITDQPELAIQHCEKLFNKFRLNGQALAFEEYLLPSKQTGDIVVVRNNTLLDYRKEQDAFSQHVQNIAKEFGLPREMSSPVMLKFSTKNAYQKAKVVSVYHRQTLVKQFDINDRFSGEKFEGSKGELQLAMQHKHVHIAGATCTHKTCMQMGSIHKAGQNLVCIPNELRITISGENEFGVDGVVS